MGFLSSIGSALGGIGSTIGDIGSSVLGGIKSVTGGIGDILNPISGVLGGAAGYIGAKDTNDLNEAMQDKAIEASALESEKNRKFLEYMSNSAYRRTMDDMRQAGINPILAYKQGGASSGAGSAGTGYSAQATNVGAAAVSGFEKAQNTALAVKMNKAVVSKVQQEASNLKDSKELIKSQKWYHDALTETQRKQYSLLNNQATTEAQRWLTEVERTHSARMANEVLKETIPSLIMKSRYAKDSPNLMMTERILQSIGKLLSPAASALPNVNIKR